MNLTLISGGAKGSDSVFEELAIEKQFNIKIYHPNDKFSSIDKMLININKNYINRTYPTQNEYVNNLLRRDYIIGTEADIVYAISWFDNNGLHGGTAWAVMSFINNCINFVNSNYIQSIVNFPCYIYDQNIKQWYQIQYNNLNIKYVKISKAPLLSELNEGIKFAGIGTREINTNGIYEIKKLFL